MEVVNVLDWFKSLNAKERPVTVEIKGVDFAVKQDGTLGDPVRPVIPIAPVATPVLSLATLTGLVAAFGAKVDGFDALGASAVQVESYESVALVSLKADEWGRRQVWARAKSTEANGFPFENYQDSEPFMIKLQGGFVPDDNTENLLKLCSNLTAGSTIKVADDGFSQTIEIKEGGVQTGAVTIPPRMSLQPYRTFREVAPIASDFLLRMKAVKDGLPQIALIAVDGGRWKTDTVWAVRDWLVANLPEGTTIIA